MRFVRPDWPRISERGRLKRGRKDGIKPRRRWRRRKLSRRFFAKQWTEGQWPQNHWRRSRKWFDRRSEGDSIKLSISQEPSELVVARESCCRVVSRAATRLRPGWNEWRKSLKRGYRNCWSKGRCNWRRPIWKIVRHKKCKDEFFIIEWMNDLRYFVFV